jgi:hypothetical protein
MLISTFIILSLALITVRFFIAQNSYEKITGFYFIFSNIILLILANSVANFNDILDMVILLLLLEMITILFLLFNRKKI